MSEKRIDCDSLIGKKFNRLTVTGAYRDSCLRVICICNCDCGTMGKTFLYAHLKKGRSKSCGCFFAEKFVRRNLVIANDLDAHFVGVYKTGKKYIAQIKHVSPKLLHLGTFDTREEAQKARVLKELELLDKINERLYEKNRSEPRNSRLLFKLEREIIYI